MTTPSAPAATMNGAITSAIVVGWPARVSRTSAPWASDWAVARATSARLDEVASDRKEGAPGGGEAQPPVGPVEEAESEVGLEPAQLTRERRLGDVEHPGCRGHGAGVHHGEEVPQQPEVHRMPLRYGKCAS